MDIEQRRSKILSPKKSQKKNSAVIISYLSLQMVNIRYVFFATKDT